MRRINFTFDSDDRFSRNSSKMPFAKLPHDEDGWNRFDGEMDESKGEIYYKDRLVCSFAEIQPFLNPTPYKDNELEFEENWYVTFVVIAKSSEAKAQFVEQFQKDCCQSNYWVRSEPLMFDNVPMKNFWFTMKIYKQKHLQLTPSSQEFGTQHQK